MIQFFTGEKVELLNEAAKGWIGTPFMANSDVKGRGVSCQKLVSNLYKEVGCCDIEVPDVPMGHAKFARGAGSSMVENFMVNQSGFVRAGSIEPGDLIGFRLGKIIHHLGIALKGGCFVHACYGAGVIFSSLADPIWQTRIAAIWRPIV